MEIGPIIGAKDLLHHAPHHMGIYRYRSWPRKHHHMIFFSFILDAPSCNLSLLQSPPLTRPSSERMIPNVSLRNEFFFFTSQCANCNLSLLHSRHPKSDLACSRPYGFERIGARLCKWRNNTTRGNRQESITSNSYII